MRRALFALSAAFGLLLIVAGSPARAQDGDSALTIRGGSTPPTRRPSRSRSSTPETGPRCADLTVREDEQVVDNTSAVPLDDQQSLGVVLVIDSSKSMERNALIERVREAARLVRRQQGAERPDRRGELRQRCDPRRGLHHRRGGAQRGDRLDRARRGHLDVGRHRAFRPPLRGLLAPTEPHRVLGRRRQRLLGHVRAGAGGRQQRRRHALRHGRGEPRFRRAHRGG